MVPPHLIGTADLGAGRPTARRFTVHPIAFLSLWNKGSPRRHAFLPSYLTSNEYIMNSHGPFTLLLITPSADPASSPEDIMYFALLVMGIWPSFLTVVGPADVSADFPTFG